MCGVKDAAFAFTPDPASGRSRDPPAGSSSFSFVGLAHLLRVVDARQYVQVLARPAVDPERGMSRRRPRSRRPNMAVSGLGGSSIL